LNETQQNTAHKSHHTSSSFPFFGTSDLFLKKNQFILDPLLGTNAAADAQQLPPVFLKEILK
jgi:hypothetical protein